MRDQVWRWVLGLVYIFTVATIWIAASFIVQSVVDEGVSPFLVTYICNSLFVVYIPLVEIGRYLEDRNVSIFFWLNKRNDDAALQDSKVSEEAILLHNNEAGAIENELNPDEQEVVDHGEVEVDLKQCGVGKDLDEKGRWMRWRIAKSNTILSSASSLFTFVVAVVFLGEKFTWLKLISVLLCMGGVIIVSLGDSGSGSSEVAPNPALGDILSLLSAAFYSVYITLIRQKLPDEDDKVQGRVSMAHFLGFLGLFNLLIFFPVALILELSKLGLFNTLTGKQFGLIVGKGLLDNVVSDYLWAKAVLLTTTTVATAGLSIQALMSLQMLFLPLEKPILNWRLEIQIQQQTFTMTFEMLLSRFLLYRVYKKDFFQKKKKKKRKERDYERTCNING
ncbi:uncharacterized vacuolar membrane protein YML018C isoform X3 [Salvia miltiorrhiza]|uniref:uncharacterized vacuolar membrane protein YML018C isoform X3 n=1 Tax=Salvia miltiorrhiza TaxID=226208 RepID=UPI0025AD70CF|nr:uncharacterized vacuolar membrane protein YML018C isoform X3 [Salvia miltiorrhiza]